MAAFFAALCANLIQTLVTWFASFVTKKVKEQQKIASDNDKATQDAKKLSLDTDEQTRVKDTEDLLNGR